jgi:DNA gyrase subunit A
MGIAVGMATNIPPHNLNELCDGISFVIDNPDADIDQIMKFIKGPDFPTGGVIYDVESIKKAYSTGRGGIVMRGRAEIEEYKAGYFRIIISEIPYQVNKATLVEKIADLAKNKIVDGIRAIRDESDRNGMRVVIELKKDCFPEKTLNLLFKHTQLQSNFNVNALALVNTIEPKVLSLRNIIDEFITHRRQVITKRTEFELREARKREHILEGLKIAIDNIDEVIATIKKSANQNKARENLMKKFKLTEIQANAILEMQLRRLAALERQKIEDELKEILFLIEKLEEILGDVQKIDRMIKEDLSDLQKKYGDKRKTKIIKSKIGEFSAEDLISKESTVVIHTKDGYIKRILPDNFKAQRRGGKGVIGLATKETDLVADLFITNTHSDILFFTTSGKVFRLKVYEIPETSRVSKGQALVNFLQISTSEKVSGILPMDNIADAKYLLMVTRKGTIKKVDLSSFDNVRKSGLIAINLKDDDVLEWAKTSNSKNDLFITTANGQSIRFSEDDIRPTGRSAAGVRGIRLKKDDIVVGFDVVEKSENSIRLLSVSENGYAKFTNCKEYKTQKRGGSGVKTMNIGEKTGKLVSSRVIKNGKDDKNIKDGDSHDDLIIVSRKGKIIRIPLKDIPTLKRATTGVRIMKFKKLSDKIASVSVI